MKAKRKDLKDNKFLTILFCVGVIAGMLLLQSVTAALGVLPKALSILAESGGRTEAFTVAYTEYVSSTGVLTYLTFFADQVCILVAAIWYYRGYVKKDKEEGVYKPIGQKLDGIKSVAFIACGCLASWGLAAILQRIVSMLMPVTASNVNSAMSQTLGGNVAIGIIIAVVLAPIMEELTVRGIILQRSKKAFGLVGCMIISALMFGLFHMNLIQAVYVIPMGLFWGFVGYKFNSVIPCIFCHMLNNFLGVIIPAKLNPVIIFIVFAVITAFLGAKFGYFNPEDKENKEELVNVEEI